MTERSTGVTVLAWLVIVASALFSLVSALALLMLLAGGDGTQSTTLSGFLSVVVAPPATLVAGIALLRRRPWAHSYLLALFGVLLATSVWDFWRANPAPVHYVSPSGVPTTILSTDRTIFVPGIVVSTVMLGVLLSRRVRSEFARAEVSPAPVAPAPAPTKPAASHESRGWRVGHVGRDRMYYEELHDGAWRRLDVDGELLTGRAHHAVHLASPERWLAYPEWARHRRDEIVARIRSEFREPDYDYSQSGGVPSPRPLAPAPAASGSTLAALTAAAILLALAGGTSWLAYDGVATGTTVLPTKSATQRRPVPRAGEPILFWVSIGLYASIAAGCVGLVAWGAAQMRSAR